MPEILKELVSVLLDKIDFIGFGGQLLLELFPIAAALLRRNIEVREILRDPLEVDHLLVNCEVSNLVH